MKTPIGPCCEHRPIDFTSTDKESTVQKNYTSMPEIVRIIPWMSLSISAAEEAIADGEGILVIHGDAVIVSGNPRQTPPFTDAFGARHWTLSSALWEAEGLA